MILREKRVLLETEKYMESNKETHKMTALEIARKNVYLENPDLPMKLKFEVTPPETIEKLLTIDDLTLPTPEEKARNIIGIIFDNIVTNLEGGGFKNINIVRGNPVVSAEDNFDNLFFSKGNPGRSSTYSRYVDEDSLLRTHISSLVPETMRKFNKDGLTEDFYTFIFPGLAYRRDVIDPRHLDVFHQIDVWTIQENKKYGVTGRKELLELAKAVFDAACPGAEMVVLEAKHPYTIHGIEVYAKIGDREIEVLEAGLFHPDLLKMAGVDESTHSGLALGMGVERLIMARKNLPDIRLIRSTDPRVTAQMSNFEPFKQVSNQPAIKRDMSYCVAKDDTEEDICEKIKSVFGEKSDLIEEVVILSRTHFDQLEPIAVQRLGAKPTQDNILVRITLRHPDVTLTKKESAELYDKAYPLLHEGDTSGYVVG